MDPKVRERRVQAKDVASRIGFALGCESQVLRRSKSCEGFGIQLKLSNWHEMVRVVSDDELDKWNLLTDLEKAIKIGHAVERLKSNRTRTEESFARSMA